MEGVGVPEAVAGESDGRHPRRMALEGKSVRTEAGVVEALDVPVAHQDFPFAQFAAGPHEIVREVRLTHRLETGGRDIYGLVGCSGKDGAFVGRDPAGPGHGLPIEDETDTPFPALQETVDHLAIRD